mgnify:CR=1 FL=1
MSVGSDPIECCVRGRFLCVCVTARRRGFRGGAFCVGAPRNFFRPVSRAFPASVSRRGGDRRGLPLPVRCAFRFAARAGSSPPGLLPTTDDGRTSFVPHLGRGAGGGRHCFLSLRFGGRGPCWRFSRSGRLRTKVRIAFDRSKTRCMLRPFRAGPLPSAGPAAEEDGPSLSIRER